MKPSSQALALQALVARSPPIAFGGLEEADTEATSASRFQVAYTSGLPILSPASRLTARLDSKPSTPEDVRTVDPRRAYEETIAAVGASSRKPKRASRGRQEFRSLRG